jgi:aminoglycoside phosphotransferase (APT) family kinase protein
VEGEEYQHDFERIMGQESLEERDKQKALILSDYLARLHARTFRGSGAARSSIQRRHTRDCIGNGEMLMGVLDTYPANGLDRKRRIAIIQKAVALRETIKDMPSRVCRMHGDFHPGNIYFEKKKLLVADASRELWGSPADDLTSLGINYLWHALKQKGRFSGPFRELFDAFWGNYMRKTRDTAIGRFAPLFLAFRGTVITHPVFYKNQSGAVRKKVYRFILQVLDKGPFDYRKVDQYI